jgi:hypothetical protein
MDLLTDRAGPRGHQSPRRADLFLLALALAFVAQALHAGILPQSKTAAEYELRAAFVYNFAKFVEWPPESFGDGNSPIHVCIAGNAAVAGAFQHVLGSKTVNRRELVIHRLTKPPGPRACQILYLAAENVDAAWQERMTQADVLSVGESEEFGAQGGMIRLLREGDRLRFVIYRDNVERSRLKVSSKLMALSKGPEK